MGKQCEVDDNVSSTDQVSRNLVSSVSDCQTGKENSREADVSTVSSERAHSANNTFVRSDMSSEIGQALNEKRKHPSAVTADELSQGDSTAVVLHPRKQLKSDSSLSKNSATLSNNHVYSHPTQSVESKKIILEFDLNEGTNDGSSSDVACPIPVVAKVGIPAGMPEKPLKFSGELGWKRSGIPSAFHPTPHKNSDIIKTPFSRGFDLNVAAIDSAVPDSVLGIDLNHNPMTEEPSKSIYPQGETRQLLRNFDTYSHVSPNVSFPRPPYWVDLTSVRGYGHVQGQPFLLGAPTTEQVQMLVPIQLPNTPPGLYIGKANNFTSGFYPHSVLQSQQMPGPPAVFTAYPGNNIQLVENPQGLVNPNGFAHMRQTILSNGSRAGHPAENLMSQMNSRQLNSWNY